MISPAADDGHVWAFSVCLQGLASQAWWPAHLPRLMMGHLSIAVYLSRVVAEPGLHKSGSCVQAAAAGDRARQEALGQQAHEAQQAHVAQLQLLQESNSAMR